MKDILTTAKKHEGLQEVKDRDVLIKYFKKAGLDINPATTPWCAAFVNSVLNELGIKGTGKLTARSFMQWGKEVELKDAQPGDIVIFSRGDSSWQGHVAIYVKHGNTFVTVLGGNQNNKVCEAVKSVTRIIGVRRAP